MTEIIEVVVEAEPAIVEVVDGVRGPRGLPSTVPGPKGDKGEKGDTGLTGPKGDKGDKGDQGEQGIQGERGLQGETGPRGLTGAQGEKGDTGEAGATGPRGLQGPRGIQGSQGPTGDAGPQGPDGPRGLTGPAGEQGPKGDKGDQGEVGPAGPQGATGNEGPAGPAGPTGPAGPKGDKGDTGDQGPAGPQGQTGASGITWRGTWSNTGEYVANDAVFHNAASWFAVAVPPVGSVPSNTSEYWSPLALQGATGPAGPTGATGETGARGPAGATGPQGEVGPAGPTGPQGPQGDDGLNGIIFATTPPNETNTLWYDTDEPAGQAVASVTGTSPITVTGTTLNPVIGLDSSQVNVSNLSNFLPNIDMKPGYYYPAAYGMASSSMTHVGGYLVYVPMYLTKRIRITRIGAYCSTYAAGSQISFAIYSDLNDKPRTKLAEVGPISTATSTGFKYGTIDLVLDPGWYWTASLATGGNPVMSGISQTMTSYKIPAGETAPGGIVPGTYAYNGYLTVGATSLPATAGGVTGTSTVCRTYIGIGTL